MIGRHPRGNIIAYQIKQSFKPGEITPDQVGYETAMRFTKGNHAFIVATHTDKAHIHNHIIFNSTSLDCTHKFRDFFFCWSCFAEMQLIRFLGKAAQKILMSYFINWKMPDTRLSVESIFL